jgi:hypothetical protein
MIGSTRVAPHPDLERVVSWLDRCLERFMAVDRADGRAVECDLDRRASELRDDIFPLDRERC